MKYDMHMKQTGRDVNRILFLDIDGVLNRSSFGEDMYHDFLVKHRDKLVEDDVPLYMTSVSALKKIIESVNDIGIVWSTDWRFETRETYDGWKNPKMWLECQPWLASCIVGNTPMKMSSNRFEEIQMWFSSNDADNDHINECSGLSYKECCIVNDIKNYIIVDDFDSPGMETYGDHFFHIDPLSGLTNDIADTIIQFLKNDNLTEGISDWSRGD